MSPQDAPVNSNTSHDGTYRILERGESADGEPFLRVEAPVLGRNEVGLISMRDLVTAPDRAITRLRVPILTPSAKRAFLEEAQSVFQTKQSTFRVATKPGWLGRTFVLADGTTVPQRPRLSVCLPQDLQRFGESFHSRGTLKGWKRIARLARGNTRFMLAISLSFVGPVAAILGLEEPMFQVFGPPG